MSSSVQPQDDTSIAPDLEELLQKYQLTVFTLAMHLLNDAKVARAVVEEVFLQLRRKRPLPGDPQKLESLLHATTYDVALAELVRIRRAKSAH